jgi:REP element-mobilizing transposase RayT
VNNYNPNIHLRKSIRLRGYDYSKAGLYYITICTEDNKCLFGKIVPAGDKFKSHHEMILNDAGENVDCCWLMIPEHFPNVVLHEYVIMPNHIHGIIELRKKPVGSVGVENFQPLQSMNDSETNVGVQNFEPLHIEPQRRNEYQKIIPHSIGSIIRGFKTGATKWFRNNTNIEKIWLRNYYEHIIRNEPSYEQIANYIIENPDNWKKDDFYKCE